MYLATPINHLLLNAKWFNQKPPFLFSPVPSKLTLLGQTLESVVESKTIDVAVCWVEIYTKPYLE